MALLQATDRGGLAGVPASTHTPQPCSERGRERTRDRWVAFASGQREHRASVLDRRALPDGGTEALTPVGELCFSHASLAQRPCGTTGGVEALLRRINRGFQALAGNMFR